MSKRERAVADFMSVYAADPSVHAAGSSAQIQALIESNIDDRGRLNGRAVLNHFLNAGVSMEAARGLMDRFVQLRRGQAAGGAGTGAPRAAAATPRPEVSDPRRRGLGVVKKKDAERRTGAKSPSPRRQPAKPDPQATAILPWGNQAASPDAATARLQISEEPAERERGDPEATHVTATASADTRIPQKRATPSVPPRPAAAPAARPASPPAAAPRPMSVSPTPAPRSAATPLAPALEQAAQAAAAQPEISDPGRKRAATEIRGTPIAASAAPRREQRAESMPPEIAAALGMAKKPDKDAEKAERAAAKAAKRDAKAQKAEKPREIRPYDPKRDRSRVHSSVIVAAGAAVLSVAALVLAGQPMPDAVSTPTVDGALPCVESRATAKELFCFVDEATTKQPPATLAKKAKASQEAAEAGGYAHIWFFRLDTGRVWHPVPPLAPVAVVAAAPVVASNEGGAAEAEASASDEDAAALLKALQTAPAPSAGSASDDDGDRGAAAAERSSSRSSETSEAKDDGRDRRKKRRKKRRKRKKRRASQDD